MKKRCGTIRCKFVLGARHRDIEQPPLLLDLGRRAGGEVGRNAAVDDVEHEHRLPFLALGGMDGREDQIVLVEQRHARPGRWSRPADRASARSGSARATDSRGDLLELQEIGLARRAHPRGCARDAARTSGAPARARPASPARARRDAPQCASTKAGQCSPAAAGGSNSAQRRDRVGAPRPCGRARLRRGRRPDAGQQLQRRESRRRGRADSRRSAAAPARP